MKATILLEQLNCGNCIAYVSKKLSKIEDIHDILPDAKSSKITFTYDSEGAALEAVGVLSSFRKLERKRSLLKN